MEMEIIKEKLYERGTFSNTYYWFLEQYGIAREYSKKSPLDYTLYEEKIRRRSGGAEGNRAYGNRGIEQNGTGSFEETRSNEIAPEKASLTDGVFFDGKDGDSYSLSDAAGDDLAPVGRYDVRGEDVAYVSDDDLPIKAEYSSGGAQCSAGFFCAKILKLQNNMTKIDRQA